MSESRVRENRMPGLKRRGLETERQTGVTVTGVAQPTGKPAEDEGPRTYHTGEATASVSDPTQLRTRFKKPRCAVAATSNNSLGQYSNPKWPPSISSTC